MKRPPKTKNSAAVARATTGATSADSPDFYRISRIAPLPVASPSFAASSQNDNDAADQIDPFTDADPMQMVSWGTPQPVEKNPFDDDSSPESVNEKDGSATLKSNDGVRSDNTPSQSQETERLSETDLNYLAHQNRLFLMYARQTKH
jgi:hypothetical protein